MHDMKPLEDSWRKYQLKKRKPLYMLFFILLLIVFILYYFLGSMKNETKVFDTLYQDISTFVKNNSEHISDTSRNSILVNGSLKKLEVLDEINIVKSANKDISTDNLLVDIPILDLGDTPSRDNAENIKKEKKYIDIFETTSISAYEDVEKRFKQTGDIDDALFLAKSYYKKGNFEKSEHWAFETNKIDSSLEESFLIFVKSKSKLGKTNEAISILNTYLKQTNSQEARVLLEQLKNDKF